MCQERRVFFILKENVCRLCEDCFHFSFEKYLHWLWVGWWRHRHNFIQNYITSYFIFIHIKTLVVSLIPMIATPRLLNTNDCNASGIEYQWLQPLGYWIPMIATPRSLNTNNWNPSVTEYKWCHRSSTDFLCYSSGFFFDFAIFESCAFVSSVCCYMSRELSSKLISK